jgi:hypothetical protein
MKKNMAANIVHAEEFPATKKRIRKKYALASGTKTRLKKTGIAFVIFT